MLLSTKFFKNFLLT